MLSHSEIQPQTQKETPSSPYRSRRKLRTPWPIRLLSLCLLGIALFSSWKLISLKITDQEGVSAYQDLILQSTLSQKLRSMIIEKKGGESATISVNLKEIDFDSLQATNPDVVGWLELEGTIIDYPLVQGTDNSYYLTHLLDGTYHRFGTLFLDAGNAGDFTDTNTIIYGHHIKAGDMFCILKYYRNQSYYDEHPYFILYTPDATYRIDLFAGCLIDGTKGLPLTFSDKASYQEYLNTLTANSTFVSDIEMTTDDQMISLYTCAYDFTNAKYVVFGKLVKLDL